MSGSATLLPPIPGVYSDTSQTSWRPQAGGIKEFVIDLTNRLAVVAFPQLGGLVIQSNDDPSIIVLARIKSWLSPDLIFAPFWCSVDTSTTYDSWTVTVIDNTVIPQFTPDYNNSGNGYVGLYVSSLSSAIQPYLLITGGRSYGAATDAPQDMVKNYSLAFTAGTGGGAIVLSAQLSGTVTITTGSVVGVGTAFTTDFKIGSTLTTSTGNTYCVAAITDDTNMVVDSSSATEAGGTTIQRGGIGISESNYDDGMPLVRVILYTMGSSIDFGLASCNAAGTYDAPSGWSVTAAIGKLNYISPGGSTFEIVSLIYGARFEYYDGAVSGLAAINLQAAIDLLAASSFSNPMTTTGDMIYRTTVPARLAIGTANQILRTNSGATAPNWTNGYLAVASGSLPAAATQDVTIPAGYSDILISWDAVSSGTATREFQIRVSTDGGSTYDSTAANYGGTVMNALTPVLGPKARATIIESATVTAAQTFAGSAVISGYASGAYKTFTSHTQAATGQYSNIGTYRSTSAITNIRFQWDGSGNFDAGTYVVAVK